MGVAITTDQEMRKAIIASVRAHGYGFDSFANPAKNVNERVMMLKVWAHVLEDVGLQEWHPQLILDENGVWTAVAAMDNSTDATKNQRDIVQYVLPGIFECRVDSAHSTATFNVIKKAGDTLFMLASTSNETLEATHALDFADEE